MLPRAISLIEKIIAGGVLLALASPLLVTPGLVFPFHTGRVVFLGIVAAIIIIPAAVLFLYSPSHRPRWSLPLLALGAYLLVHAVTGFFGIDPVQSFWGRDERMMGTVTVLYLMVVAVGALMVFRDARKFRTPLAAAVAVAGIVALLSIHEHFFPGPWRAIAGGGGRTAGTLGNPIFLANYLMPHVFLALYLMAGAGKQLRLLCSAVIAVIIAAMGYSLTRGAMLGLFAGTGMLAVGWIAMARGRRRAIGALAALVVLVVFVGGYIAARQSPRLWSHQTLGPYLQISTRLITVEERFLLWKIAWRAFAERPLLGWGPENFDYAYDRQYDPRFLRFSLHETWLDRAHNVFLDSLNNSGIFGLITLLGITIIPALALWRAKRGGAVSPFEAVAALGFAAAVLVQNISAFDTPSSLLTLFLFISLAASVAPYQTEARAELFRPGFARVFFVVLAASAAALGAIFVSVRTAVAARNLSQALHAATGEELLERGDAALRRWSPYRHGFRLRYANVVFLGAGRRFKPPEETMLLRHAISELLKNSARAPGDMKSVFSLANLELIQAIDVSAERYAAARAYYDLALAISPERQTVLFQIGNLELIRGNAAAAVEAFTSAAVADEQSAEPWWHLGRALVTQAAREERVAVRADLETQAYASFERGRERGYTPSTDTDVQVALPLYAKRGDYAGFMAIAEDAVAFNPRNVDFWTQLAAVSAELGLKEKARDAIAHAVSLDPSLRAEAEAFLKNLSSEGGEF